MVIVAVPALAVSGKSPPLGFFQSLFLDSAGFQLNSMRIPLEIGKVVAKSKKNLFGFKHVKMRRGLIILCSFDSIPCFFWGKQS